MPTQNMVGTTLSGQSGTGSFAGTTSPTFVTPILGAATGTSLAFSPSTGGLIGTTTNNDASAGIAGEYLAATSGSTGITTATTTNIQTLSLTAGDWEIWGCITFAGAAGTLATTISASVSSTSATFSNMYQQFQGIAFGSGASNTIAAPPFRVSIGSTTTVYLVGYAVFTVSTMNTIGTINARRRR